MDHINEICRFSFNSRLNHTNGWSCNECTFQNDTTSVQCKICQTKRNQKRGIHAVMHNINEPALKKQKLNETYKSIASNKWNSKRIQLPQPNDTTTNADDMEELYFPQTNHKNRNHNLHTQCNTDTKNNPIKEEDDDTLNLMDQFEFGSETAKLRRIKKHHHNTNDTQMHVVDDDDGKIDFDIENIASHLSRDMFLYYSGDDVEAMDWSGNQYKSEDLWELEKIFFEWKQRYKGCLLMIQNGYKYEFYEGDAVIVSMVLGVFTTRKCGALLKALLPQHKLHIYLRRLVEFGLMVAVVQQTQTGATRGKKQKMIDREITGVFTKGTLFAPHITERSLDNTVNNKFIDAPESADGRFILCFHEIPLDGEFDMAHKVEFNLIVTDLYCGVLYCDCFEDDFLRAKFVTILNHFNVCEIIAPRHEISHNTRNMLRARYDRLGCVDSVRWIHYQIKEFEYSECNTLLTETFSDKHGEWLATCIFNALSKSMIISFGMLVFYLQKFDLADTLVHCRIQTLNDTLYMKLNGITTQHLEIFCNTNGGTTCTLFEWMSRNNQTAYGKRLMHEWVSRPLMNTKQIEERQDAVRRVMELKETLSPLVQQLSRSGDLERRLRIIQCNKCPPKLFLNTMKELNQILKVLPHGNCLEELNVNSWLHTLFASIKRKELLEVVDAFTSKLNEDMTGYDDAIRDISQYPKMMSCQEEIESAEQTLAQLMIELRKMLQDPDLNWKSVKTDHYQVEIAKTTADTTHIPSNWRLNSETKTHLRYQPIEVEIAARTVAIQREKMLFEAKRAWFHFVDDFNEESDVFCEFVSCLSQFDCIYSMAMIASNLNYVLPQFIATQEEHHLLQIKNGRHPTLEEYLSSDTPFIANDIDLSRVRHMVITGPNMGGKSVYIKMIACLIIMSQMGSYVPAQSMRLTPFDMIGTRIGSSDCILSGKSTFFVEMAETSHLIARASHKSLVIVDEVGRGTSTFDGTAMAYASLKYMIDTIECMTLFVTHYTDLLTVKHEYAASGVVDNYYMTYQHKHEEDQIAFLYKIRKGECNNSYGIQVAQAAGIDDDIVKRARQCSKNMRQYVMNGANQTMMEEFHSLLLELNIV
eukprot:302082_1